MSLTPTQLAALRWLADFPSHKAGWLDEHGKHPMKGPTTWTQFQITGSRGSIIISESDLRALDPYVSIQPKPDQMYGANEAGLAILASPPAPEAKT